MAKTRAVVGARRLREVRRLMGLSQGEVAAKLGVTQPFWSALENGRKVPTLGLLFDVAVALGADPAEVDPRLASTAATLTLRRGVRGWLVGEGSRDQALLRDLVGADAVRWSLVRSLVRVASESGVRLVFRFDKGRLDAG